MHLRSAAFLALALVLTACGGDAEPRTEAKSAAATKAAMDGALPSVSEGESVPEALSGFVCKRDDAGTWSASGAVTNRSTEPVSFQVTVHVGDVSGQGEPASTRHISSVQKNGSVGFELEDIETKASDGTCHVKVLALDEGL